MEKMRRNEYIHWGWGKIVDDMLNALEEINPTFEICQVKEKFGELRFYYAALEQSDWQYEAFQAIIDRAIQRSRKTCQWCGFEPSFWYWYDRPDKEFTNSKGYWIRSICNHCETLGKRGLDIGKYER